MASARPPPPPPAASPAPPPHLVSLKVLRSTRPALVPADPLAHGYAPPASHSHHAPRAAHPGRGTLSLPTSFANIYLGETFNAVLSLSNDLVVPPASSSSSAPSSTTALAPVLHVEMHTNLGAPQPGAPAPVPVKHLLAHVDPSSPSPSSPAPAPAAPAALAPGEALAALGVAHELKELGPHALVCTVSYGVEVPGSDSEGEGGTRVVTRSFRKVYKFHVANPLSVRTKAHAPSPLLSPTSALSRAERTKVFLEVQVHNHCEGAMRFERMRFVPLPGWTVAGDEDAVSGEGGGGDAQGEGAGAHGAAGGRGGGGGGARPRRAARAAEPPLAPGAVRQFLFVLDRAPPAAHDRDGEPEFEPEPEPAPGASQGLGRLDIVWRTAHGEVGRLQSSTLGRRVPLPPSLGGGGGGGGGGAAGVSEEEEAQEGEEGARGPSDDGLAFELVVDGVRPAGAARPTSEAHTPLFVVDEPFAVQLRARVRSKTGSTRRRRLRLAAQHVEWHAPALGLLPSSFSSSPSSPISTSSLSPLALALPSGSALPLARPGGTGALPPLGPRPTAAHHHALDAPPPLSPSPQQHGRPAPTLRGVRLPLAVPSRSAAAVSSPVPSPGVVRLGAGLVDLGSVVLEPAGAGAGPAARWHDVGWTWRFVPRAEGLLRVGGLRVLFVESESVDGEGEGEGEGEGQGAREEERRARTVLEVGTVAEVWVEA